MERGRDTEDEDGERLLKGDVINATCQEESCHTLTNLEREVDGCYAKRCTPVFVCVHAFVCVCVCLCVPVCVSLQFACHTHSHVCIFILDKQVLTGFGSARAAVILCQARSINC